VASFDGLITNPLDESNTSLDLVRSGNAGCVLSNVG
jgi:hypothetical protein